MHRLLLSVLCLGAVALADDLVKNKTAAGYYGGSSSDQPVQNFYVPLYPPAPQLVERNVCDLDASVLLVTDHRRHGQNRAVRVRCSEIANYDEDSCNVCCQNAARRDRNLQNSDMYGFLAVVDELHHKENSREESEEEDDDHLRKKRSAHHSGEHHTGEVDYTYVKQESWKPDPQNKNLKCVCCAPKRALPPPPVFYNQYQPQYPAQAPPTGYGQVPAASPVQYQAPAPAQGYQAPAQAPVQQYPAQAPVQQQYPAQAPVQQQYPAQAPVQQYAAQAPAYQAQAQAPVKQY